MTEFAILLAADITQVIDSIAWVRCASGNVVKYWPPGADTLTVFSNLANRWCHLHRLQIGPPSGTT